MAILAHWKAAQPLSFLARQSLRRKKLPLKDRSRRTHPAITTRARLRDWIGGELPAESVSLTFPDGSVRGYDAAMTGAALAESISKSLAKKAVAYAIDGIVRDLVRSSGTVRHRSKSSPATILARLN